LWREGRLERTEARHESPTNTTGEVRCWGAGEDATGTTHNWGDGLCVRVPDIAGATSTVAPDRVRTISVGGAAVRAWTESERQAWQTFTHSIDNPSSFERLATELVRAAQADDRIIDLEVVGGDDPDEVVSLTFTPVIVRYQAPMNLFGFIPMEREVQATIDNQVRLQLITRGTASWQPNRLQKPSKPSCNVRTLS
jgi:hypothetical protein